MDILYLPKTLSVGGVERGINSDWRACFTILQLLERPDLLYHEQLQVIVGILFDDEIEPEYHYEAVERAFWFLDGGDSPKSDGHNAVSGDRVYSWVQDAKYIIAAVDRVLGRSCRAISYLHWWDFLSAFMEVGECTFTTLVHQRKLRKTGKQSDVDRQWWSENRDIAELRIEKQLSLDEQDALDRFNKLLG